MQTIPLDDRGLLYGDGLFTTMPVIEGRVLNRARHWQRLANGCARLGMPVPEQNRWNAELFRRTEGMARGVLKCLVTRGAGGRGYRPPAPARTRLYWIASPWPDYPSSWWTNGVTVRVCRLRLGWQPALAGIKHLNRLEQVLARAEWEDPEIAEGLVLDQAGHLIEGCMSNVFFLDQRGLHTPALHNCGVAGIIRDMILEITDAWGIPLEQADYPLEALQDAEEIFLTNSLIGLWPVRRLEQRNYSPGPLSRRLQAYLLEHHAAYAKLPA
jgi:4-amino-4-deoxychorismate lyase